ncbi:MAG TPA: flagellar hook-associated protein FlgK [Rhizobacter sp.]|nr:flagellar hook-associated protein FlgK [Rhizobacter sp.]
MAASSLMSIGTRAMFANYAALTTVGNNIANANTTGYSRQQVELATAKGLYTGAGFFGQGVNVTTVTRSYDRFLTTQAAATNSLAAADSARLDQLSQLEGVFPLGEAGIGQAARQVLDAFVDVANNPQDASARQVVLTRAQELAVRIKTAGDQLNTLQSGVSQNIKSNIDSVNSLARQVADLNKQISALNGAGHSPNDLLDQRDILINEISSYINVTTIQADDGSVGLFIGGGQSLVLGANANTLVGKPDVYDPSLTQLALREGSVDRPVLMDSIAGGSIAGLVRFQNDDLNTARNLLGQLAVSISGAINQQQSLGLDAGQPASAGAPMFSVGAPRTLPASGNTGDAQFGLTVTDFTHVQASDYELRFDGTNYSLTRMSDGSTAIGSPFAPAALAAGVQVDGLTLQWTAGASAQGDRYLLQAAGPAAAEMRSVLSDPKGLAAAAAVTGSFAVTNTGTASAASLGLVDPTSYDPTLTTRITFNTNTGDYSYDLLDASSAVVGSGTGTWTAGNAININGFALQLNGVPRSGDVIDVAATTSPASNNGNATAFVALGSTAFVGASTLANGTLVPGRTITDAYASALSDIGVRVQSAKSSASISASIASTAEATRANKAGVNLDEEAARLIQFQQSYQAAAKMLQVAQSVFDTLLEAAGR